MKRRIAAVFVGAALIGGTMVAAQAGPAGADTLNLRLKESICGKDGTYCKFLDQNPKGGFGDSLVFSLPLEYRSDETRAGRDEGECINLHPDSEKAYCTFVAHLEDGDIAVQGTLHFEGSKQSRLPITGGTDAYEGASGYWQQSGRQVVIHIETP